MGATKRKRILDEASGYVCADRNASYGEPEDNFGNIAAIWNAQGVSINGRPVNATDVALMMVGMKLARLKTNPSHRDSWVDGAGYLACGGDIALPTEFADWETLTPIDETTNEHVGDALRTWQPGDKANVSELAERERATGWISDNRCGQVHEHMAHAYGRSSSGAVLHDSQGGQWCDGYVAPGWQAQRAIDIEAVKRVADKVTQQG